MTIIVFLSAVIVVLLIIILYQQLTFRVGIRSKVREIGRDLKRIMDTDSDEKIYVFTEDSELMELAAQINRLLENHLIVKADYRRSEMAYKKMLSNISHDMKTPMTVILGYLEIMRHRDNCQDGMLEKTEQKAKDVMELINQFFTLAKLESGDMEPELAKIDVCEICRKSILDFYELLTNREFQVEVDLPETPVYVQGSQEFAARILSNLISNVTRYGADGRYLGLSLRMDELRVFIDVTDKGKGIDAAFADSVFERLFTMEDSRNREIQGNGLGLTIAKELARKMGGDITLESSPYEKTTFTVSFVRMAY